MKQWPLSSSAGAANLQPLLRLLQPLLPLLLLLRLLLQRESRCKGVAADERLKSSEALPWSATRSGTVTGSTIPLQLHRWPEKQSLNTNINAKQQLLQRKPAFCCSSCCSTVRQPQQLLQRSSSSAAAAGLPDPGFLVLLPHLFCSSDSSSNPAARPEALGGRKTPHTHFWPLGIVDPRALALTRLTNHKPISSNTSCNSGRRGSEERLLLQGLRPRLLVAAARRMHSAAAAPAASAASCADRTVAANPCCCCCGLRPPSDLQRMPSRGFNACRKLAAAAGKGASPKAAAATAGADTATTAAATAAATPPAEQPPHPATLLLLLQRPAVLLEQRRHLHRSTCLLHPGKQQQEQQQQQQGDAAEAATGAAVDGFTAAKETVEAASAGVSHQPSQDPQAPLQLRAAFAPQPAVRLVPAAAAASVVAAATVAVAAERTEAPVPRRPPEERRRWSTWWKVSLFVLGAASPFVAAAVIFRALLQQRQQQHELAQLATADVEEALKAAQRVVVGGATCILISASESDNRIFAGRVDPHLPESRVLRLPKEEVIPGVPNNAVTHLIAGRRSPVSLPFNFVHFSLKATSAVARQIREGQKLLLALLYVDPHSGDSVMLSGVAAAVDASAYKSYYWKTSWGAVFPGGSMSPDYELVKFVPSSVSIDLSAAGAPIRLSRVVTDDSIFWAFENACGDRSTHAHADGNQHHLTAAAAVAAAGAGLS
ncbi:hypothetical protein Emag_001311 [Eimeria magna]